MIVNKNNLMLFPENFSYESFCRISFFIIATLATSGDANRQNDKKMGENMTYRFV